MASEVGIANTALRLIGKKVITAFTDGTPAANFMADRYSEMRDELLREHNWNFAAKRVKLARNVTAPVFGFDYAYNLPADWIRTTSVHDSTAGTSTVEFREENGAIVTDASEVWLRYVARIEDPNMMPPDFRLALSYRLAEEAAIAIAESNTLRDRMESKAKDMMRKARSVDGLGQSPEQLARGSWVTKRWGGLHW